MITRLTITTLLVTLLFSSPAAAQAEKQVTGTVRDASGLVIAGATVTAPIEQPGTRGP